MRKAFVRKGIPVAAAVLVLAGGSIAYAVTSSGNGNRYVTAAVARTDVQQLLNLTGSVRQVKQQSQTFHASAPVASVSVAVGDTVTAGQVLATLDPATLKSAVLDARATLAAAQAKVETDSTSSSTATSSTGSESTNTASTSSESASSGASTAIAAAQTRPASSATASKVAATPGGSPAKTTGGTKATGNNQLADAQRAVAADLKAAAAVLANARAACTTSASATPSESATPPASATSPAPSSAPPTPSASTSPSSSPTSSPPSCLAALQDVQSAQQKTATDQQALATLLSKQASSSTGSAPAGGTKATGAGGSASAGTGSSTSASSGRTGTTGQAATSGTATGGSQPSGSNSAASTGNSASTGGAAGGQSATTAAGQLLIDQAAVSSATVALTDAETDLASATLRASISGTVASVGVVKGATASSSSSIVIVGTGAAQVTVDIPLTSIRKVKVGQVSYVTPDGGTAAVPGTVQSIGLLPVTTTGSTSYPVVILVPTAAQALSTGSRAQVSIVLSTAAKVITVPNSALTSTGAGTGTVTVVTGGKASRRTVKTGTIGVLATEVTGGLSVGEQVVLADNSRSLPVNSATVSTGRFGTGGPGGTGGLGGQAGTGGQPPTGGGFGGPGG